MAGQKAKDVVIRSDLKTMMSELEFSELNLQADSIAPPVFVSKRTADYPVLPREVVAKIPDTKRAKGGGYQRGQWEWDSDTYKTREYGYEETVDEISALENEEFIDEEFMASKLSVEKLLLAREARVYEFLLDESKWSGATNLVEIPNDDRWFGNAAGANIFNIVDAAAKIVRNKCLFSKSQLTLVITEDALNEVFRTSELKDDTKYTVFLQKLPLDEKKAWLKAYLGVKEVKTVVSMYDTSGLGQDMEVGQFWSNNFGLLAKLSDGSNTLMNRNVIRQLVWSRHSRDYLIESYHEPKIKSYVYRASEYRGMKMNTDYGVLLKGIKPDADSTTGF